MRLFAFPLREGSPEVNAWAILLRVYWRKGRKTGLVLTAAGGLLLFTYLMVLVQRGDVGKALTFFGSGLLGGLIAASLGGLGIIPRHSLFLESAVTPLTTRELVTAIHRSAAPPMAMALIALCGMAALVMHVSHEQLARSTYHQTITDAEMIPDFIRENEGERLPLQIRWHASGQMVTTFRVSVPGGITGTPYRRTGLEGGPAHLLSHQRAIFIVSLVPLALAGFWLLLGSIALFILWEKTASPARVMVSGIAGGVIGGLVVGLLLIGVSAVTESGPFPLGPPPSHFQSPGELWPRTVLLCAAALGLALLLWWLGNRLWRRAARLPLDRIHETMQARQAKRAKVKA